MEDLRNEVRMQSLPSRGAWIETIISIMVRAAVHRRSPHGERGLKLDEEYRVMVHEPSLPSRGAWIETHWWGLAHLCTAASLPSRGAWIETPYLHSNQTSHPVAPLTGSVD